MNDNYIYINTNSLSKILCHEVIELFENDPNRYEGQVVSGLNKDVKDTCDLQIHKNDAVWSRIYNLLEKELTRNIKNYITKCYSVLPSGWNPFVNNLIINSIQVQKYNKNVGKYKYHQDGLVLHNQIRKLTFIWYINSVSEGGETEFPDFKIIPETGKLFIFPALWTYPHKANIPLSDDKYIITGWLYENISLPLKYL